MKRTRNPLIWLQYLCWNIQWWMECHKPYMPSWWKKRVILHYAYTDKHGQRRVAMTPRVNALLRGPFVPPWNWIARQIRRGTGGRSHRCEFTDKRHGALYGHHEGAFMNRYFEAFIVNISDDD